jgi:hypothetical protein
MLPTDQPLDLFALRGYGGHGQLPSVASIHSGIAPTGHHPKLVQSHLARPLHQQEDGLARPECKAVQGPRRRPRDPGRWTARIARRDSPAGRRRAPGRCRSSPRPAAGRLITSLRLTASRSPTPRLCALPPLCCPARHSAEPNAADESAAQTGLYRISTTWTGRPHPYADASKSARGPEDKCQRFRWSESLWVWEDLNPLTNDSYGREPLCGGPFLQVA